MLPTKSLCLCSLPDILSSLLGHSSVVRHWFLVQFVPFLMLRFPVLYLEAAWEFLFLSFFKLSSGYRYLGYHSWPWIKSSRECHVAARDFVWWWRISGFVEILEVLSLIRWSCWPIYLPFLPTVGRRLSRSWRSSQQVRSNYSTSTIYLFQDYLQDSKTINSWLGKMKFLQRERLLCK